MGYTVIDILNKAILIQNKEIEIFKSIAHENNNIKVIKLLSKILIDKTNKIINYFTELEDNISKKNHIEELDIMTYDKISFLINEFNNRIYLPSITCPKEYLLFTRDLTKDMYSLFIDIQGRLVNNSCSNSQFTYSILSEIILCINEYIKDLENTIEVLK